MKKVVIIGVAIIITVAGLYIFASYQQQHKDCENKALEAAVETYPINEYPNTGKRQSLQNSYQAKYLETCH